MTPLREAFVGIDAAKLRNAAAAADAGRDGETRCIGEIDAALRSMPRLIAKLATKMGGWTSATRPDRQVRAASSDDGARV